MTSFQISITPSRREAARFVTRVRRAIQEALVEENKKTGLTQSDIAREIGVHRSVINREIRGYKDITLGRVAELAYALGRKPTLELPEVTRESGANTPKRRPIDAAIEVTTSADTVDADFSSHSDQKAA